MFGGHGQQTSSPLLPNNKWEVKTSIYSQTPHRINIKTLHERRSFNHFSSNFAWIRFEEAAVVVPAPKLITFFGLDFVFLWRRMKEDNSLQKF